MLKSMFQSTQLERVIFLSKLVYGGSVKKTLDVLSSPWFFLEGRHEDISL